MLLSNIRRKLTSQAVKIRADIECACYGYEGIDAVKTALRAGLELSTEELPIKINLIAPPLYVMTTSTPEKADGLKALESAIEKIRETIEQLGGVFNTQMAVSASVLRSDAVRVRLVFSTLTQHCCLLQPKVVTATDEADLARRMERAEAENAEIDGDDEEDEEEGMKFDGDGGAADAAADNDDNNEDGANSDGDDTKASK